ncbi:cardiolipin synthase [Candidatus Uhrbacteria bacterium]|nr:cardiolipin synthase [Candidatus Uhrbacteria bacterium]MBD3283913.1 cardiolipin synthase [Candidatus Uhrbacteria bacterium]
MQEILIWLSSNAGSAVTTLFTINLLLIAVVILFENRAPERTLSWLLVLFAFPVVGFVLYLFFGHNWHRPSYKKRLRQRQAIARWSVRAAEDVRKLHEQTDEPEVVLRGFATRSTGVPYTEGNRVSILTDAQVTYPKLLHAIREAKRSIDLEYYIFRYDQIGKALLDLLKQKAKQGIRVRLLVDGYGSLGLGHKCFRELRAAGVQASYFAPLITLFYFFKANYRDHRKIVIVDEQTVFTGGINIGDEYLSKKPIGYWRDTHLMLHGPCVNQFITLFEEAWFRTTGKGKSQERPVQPVAPQGERINVIASGPDSTWYAVERLYLEMINRATKSLKIQTPYFIPDPGIHDALVNAVLRGVDVQLMLPRKTDAVLLRHVATTYLNRILKAGGTVFEYTKGFLHQKVLIVDDRIATIGTCNIDVRSFHLDFEVNVLLSDTPSVRHLLDDYEQDLRNCEELDYSGFLNRPYWRRIRESVLRLIAPLL